VLFIYPQDISLNTLSADPSLLGSTICISYIYIPSILLSPTPLILRQWKKSFDVAKFTQPALAVISSISYGYLAYQMQGTLDQPRAEMYGLAAVANMALFPWTMIIMMPTNKKLFRKFDDAQAMREKEEATEVGLPKGESTKELIDWWGTMNVVRGVMPLIGTVLGTWASS